MVMIMSIVTLLGGMGMLAYGMSRGVDDPLGMMLQAMGIVLFWVTLLGLAASSEIRKLRRQVDKLSIEEGSSAPQ